MDASSLQFNEIWSNYDQKKSKPSELARALLSKIKASQHGAFLTVCEDRAMEQAKRLDQILEKEGKVPREKFPLFGIPMGIKDALTIEGVRTTCASKILENYVPPYTATSVKRLEDAGVITLGKLNMDEFAMGGSNENSAFGPVKHPTHLDRVPGGSSGGSATAVGAGLCAAALGSDTGGSIRLPAHFSGITGMKPTYGTVSRFGLVAFASSLDQVGPMAHSAEDCARILEVMAGHDPLDSTSLNQKAPKNLCGTGSGSLKGLRIGIPKQYFSKGISSEVSQSVQAAIQKFESLGAVQVPVDLPHTEYAVAVYYVVAVCEASSNLARFDGIRYGVRSDRARELSDLDAYYREVRSLFGAEVKRRIILGTFALSSGYYDAYYKRACQVRRLIRDDFTNAFQECDLILGPVSPGTAFKLGEKISDPLTMYLNDILTIPVNLAGLPALSVPCGKDSQGLPIGLQMIAAPFQDERLLATADAFQKGMPS
ncbi:MAG: Asp-tRNA(Asn)/Glu-tRNA(Gln) amidotransferase subunit GatA [Bdellovibrionales bacterium]|nr:Asp-tRNA(Asn)/Glu-tRNA(Gln) amidotransferase subunit GatA [Bdellovibrionales bacterium]